MAILLTIINYTVWNIILITINKKAPNYLLDEFEEEPQFKSN